MAPNAPSHLCNYVLIVFMIFCYFCASSSLYSHSAKIDFYYPQWEPIAQPDSNPELPYGRHDAACARGTVQSSLLGPNQPTDTLVCWGGLNRRPVPDGYYLSDINSIMYGDNQHYTFVMNDINLYDIQGQQWYAVNLDNATQRMWNQDSFENGHPDGRVFATAAIHDNKLIIWGGSSTKQLLDNSLLTYDFATNQWDEVVYTNPTDAPHVRAHHSAVQYDGYMYVFGGTWFIPFAPNTTDSETGKLITNLPPYFNDLWRLDLTTLEWKQLHPTGRYIPFGRSHHSAVVTSAGKMYVWGGESIGPCVGLEDNTAAKCLGGATHENQVFSIDLTAATSSNFNWALEFRGTGDDVYPPYRAYQAAALGPQEDFFVIVGGTHNNFFMSDIYKFHLATATWELVPVAYPAADARYGHALVPLFNGTKSNPESENPAIAGDLFLMVLGRRFTTQDVATHGVLFTGGYVPLEPPESVLEGSTDTVVLAFDRESPTQRLIPKDNCGNRIQDSAVTLQFASMTERSQPDNSLIQQVDFERNLYEVNATALVDFDPSIGFTLNNTVGLSVSFDFQLFGQDTLVNYGSTSFKVPESTNKWSFNLGGWRFLDPDNTLELAVGLSLPSPYVFDKVSRNSITSERRVKYTFMADRVSIDVYISTFAIRTYEEAGVTKMEEVDVGHRVEFREGSLAPADQPKVIFILPNFGDGKLFYDPDFGVFLDQDVASSCEDDTLVTDWQIAVIVVTIMVPCLMCCFALLVFLLVMIVRRTRAKQTNDLEMIEFETEEGETSRKESASSEWQV